jgi:xanthine dehydrogenase accessory protein XdhC
LAAWIASGEPAVLVTVRAARGSTPREAGAALLVGRHDLAGTVGGGRLEWEAVTRARAVLAGTASAGPVDFPLGPALNQCCGGIVTLDFRPADSMVLDDLRAVEAAAERAHPIVVVFGAGHVGKALVPALAPLPLRVAWIDSRAGEFPDRPPPGVAIRCVPDPVALVADLPPGSAMIVLTHSHDLDFDLAAAGLRRGDLAYVGLIGSATKRAKFLRRFRTGGGSADQAGRLICPIGGEAVRDKRPPVIAALTTAEVLTTLATHRTACEAPATEPPTRDCIACPPGQRCGDRVGGGSGGAVIPAAAGAGAEPFSLTGKGVSALTP